jgi:hypothetical protein
MWKLLSRFLALQERKKVQWHSAELTRLESSESKRTRFRVEVSEKASAARFELPAAISSTISVSDIIRFRKEVQPLLVESRRRVVVQFRDAVCGGCLPL